MQEEIKTLSGSSIIITQNTTGRNLLDQAGSSLNRISFFWLCSSFSLLLFGIKLWLINFYGNATPVWDQWDAEAKNLYKPFLDGTLSWHQLFAAHNEHRV